MHLCRGYARRDLSGSPRSTRRHKGPSYSAFYSVSSGRVVITPKPYYGGVSIGSPETMTSRDERGRKHIKETVRPPVGLPSPRLKRVTLYQRTSGGGGRGSGEGEERDGRRGCFDAGQILESREGSGRRGTRGRAMVGSVWPAWTRVRRGGAARKHPSRAVWCTASMVRSCWSPFYRVGDGARLAGWPGLDLPLRGTRVDVCRRDARLTSKTRDKGELKERDGVRMDNAGSR